MTFGAYIGYKFPRFAVLYFGIVMGFLIWINMFYNTGFSAIVSFLVVVLFYVAYGFLAYLFVFRKKEK